MRADAYRRGGRGQVAKGPGIGNARDHLLVGLNGYGLPVADEILVVTDDGRKIRTLDIDEVIVHIRLTGRRIHRDIAVRALPRIVAVRITCAGGVVVIREELVRRRKRFDNDVRPIWNVFKAIRTRLAIGRHRVQRRTVRGAVIIRIRVKREHDVGQREAEFVLHAPADQRREGRLDEIVVGIGLPCRDEHGNVLIRPLAAVVAIRIGRTRAAVVIGQAEEIPGLVLYEDVLPVSDIGKRILAAAVGRRRPDGRAIRNTITVGIDMQINRPSGKRRAVVFAHLARDLARIG